MSADNIDTLVNILHLRGSIQCDIVNILSELSGYSKRRDLLEDQLRKSSHSPSGISQAIERMLAIGLLVEKETGVGTRIALTKEIWNVEPKIVQAIFKITQVLGKDRRIDTHSATVIREVRSKLSKRLGSLGSKKLFFGVANAALLSLPGWELKSGNVVRASGSDKPTTFFGETNILPTENTNEQKKVMKLTDVKSSIPEGLDFLPFDSTLIANTLKGELSGLGMVVEAEKNLCTVSASLPLGRRQKVFIAMRRDPLQRKVFWLYTICGELNKGGDYLEKALLEHNNDCGPMRVTAFRIDSQTYLGCCASLSAGTGWDKELPQIACLISNLGDQLEEKFWQKDSF